MQYFAYGAIETYLPRYLTEKSKFSTLEIGSLFTGQIVVVALTKPIMGRLSDRHGRVPIIIGGLILGGLVTAALSFSLNWFVLIVLIGLFGLGSVHSDRFYIGAGGGYFPGREPRQCAGTAFDNHGHRAVSRPDFDRCHAGNLCR